MTRYAVIAVDGAITVHDEPLGLRAMQRIVGGDIESVPHDLGEDLSIFCNDEGKYAGLAPNPVANALVAHVLRPDDFLVGPILLVGFDPATGEETDLSDEHLRTLAPHASTEAAEGRP